MVGSCVEWAKFCKDEGWESVGSKAKFTATVSLLFLDAGRLPQRAGSLQHDVARSGCARRTGRIAEGTLLAFSRGTLALFGSKQDGSPTGIARNRGTRHSSTSCVTDQAARASAIGDLDFCRPRSSADRAGSLL